MWTGGPWLTPTLPVPTATPSVLHGTPAAPQCRVAAREPLDAPKQHGVAAFLVARVGGAFERFPTLKSLVRLVRGRSRAVKLHECHRGREHDFGAVKLFGEYGHARLGGATKVRLQTDRSTIMGVGIRYSL